MRKIIETDELDWEERELFEKLFAVSELPQFLIIEALEKES